MKNIKRFLTFGVLILFIISIVGVVLAGSHGNAGQLGVDAVEGARAVGSGLNAFFSTLFNGMFFGDKEMLSRVFFAILLAMIVYSVIGSFFKKNKLLLWIATGSITALSLIAIPSNFLEAIRLSYGAMGAAILATIPFLIILLFSIKVKKVLIARIVWIFYAFYFLVLYLMSAIETGAWTNSDGTIYLISFLLGIIIFFGIPAIRNLMFKGEIEGITETGTQKAKERKARLAIEMERLKADE